MITIKNHKITVSSKTPRNKNLGNREQRRALLYRNRRQRLVGKVMNLRREMVKSWVLTVPLPHSMSRKVLSGHYGALVELAKA